MKSPVTVPLAAIFEMVKAAAPVFFKVAFCDALAVFSGTFAKVRLEGVKVTCGAVPGVPVPESGTVWGAPAALSRC